MGQSNTKDADPEEVIIENKSEQGKIPQASISELLHLLEKGEIGKNDCQKDGIQKIGDILKNDKNLLTYKYWKSNKVRSILHIAKYSSKLNYDIKQKIINEIVDVGYNLFKFSAQKPSFCDNCYALFFVAAKGDYNQLLEIIKYFREYNPSRIYDTLEGDTVLSFMIKFGDYFQKDYLECLKLMIQEGISIERVDYYKKNVREVISQEINFLQEINTVGGYMEKLYEIKDVVDRDFNINQDLHTEVKDKDLVFEAIIKEDNSIKDLLTKSLLDSDDGENTLLQLAIIKNNMKASKELLQQGANPNHVVEGRNEEIPLVLAAKLARDKIFEEVLKTKGLKITESMFAKFVKELKPKYLNSLLESKVLDVDIKYNEKTPLYYAIIRKNKKAIQSLIKRGSYVNNSYLQFMNPKDLEEYLNSCIKFDSFADDLEESNYKSLLVFDFFINSPKKDDKNVTADRNSETLTLMDEHNSNSPENYESEIEIIRWIGDNKRLKHLLEHPLVYIFIILKWHYVKKYYYYFLFLKSIFYIGIAVLVYKKFLNIFVVILVSIIQCIVVYYNYLEFKFEFGRYTLHFILEIILIVCLTIIWALNFINLWLRQTFLSDMITEISSFIIIITSISILMTIGYHIELSKWMAMAKRVFKNFIRLLLFFMIPIIAFATSFNLLTSIVDRREASENETSDFESLWGSIFRTLIMLGGDIGDKKFTVISGYLMFLIFTIGMAIILLNFWTGVAVSDIKEIEEQSTIMAFKNVIVFIESTEKMYQFMFGTVSKKIPFLKCNVLKKIDPPFLKSKINLKHKKRKFHYGIDLYINSQKPFKHHKFFHDCNLENDIISKIKSLFDDKEANMGKILKSIDNLIIRLDKIERLVLNNNKTKQKN